MNAEPPTPEELSALLRLIDDETPAVRQRVAERLALCGGDISEWIATQPRQLNHKECELLAEMLSPPRREILAREWVTPSGGASGLQEDWESFEALLCSLSDFLHDGISLRQALSDALDLLAEEACENGVTTADELRLNLFSEKRLTPNQHNYFDPRNSDLAWSIAEGKSNPLGLSLIYILTGKRLGLEIEGVNLPGHFMCRIYEDGEPFIIDCFDHGRVHAQSKVLQSMELTRMQRSILQQASGPGTMLHRLLNNLKDSLERAARDEDASLIRKLQATLIAGPI
jgi:hypothetical protein